MSKQAYLSTTWFWVMLVAITVLIALLSACSQNPQPVKPTKASIYVFGTIVDITIYEQDESKAKAAIAQVEQQFRQFHKEWHAWEKGGIVGKINQAIRDNQSIEVSDSVKAFIVKSQELSQQSQGLFEPAIGGLVKLWGFHSEQWQGPPPTNTQIQQWLQNAPSIANIQFSGNRLSSNNPNVQLDFGGNAKGLAIDIAMRTLQNNNIHNALVSLGGDMKVIGNKPNSAWSVGIQSPQNPQEAIAKIDLKANESIVTSGTYQRFFEWQGQRYSHIINPKTGYPAQTFSSVTVMHPDATTADAAATALLVAGPQQWQSIAENMNIKLMFAITQQGEHITTPNMQKRLQLLTK